MSRLAPWSAFLVATILACTSSRAEPVVASTPYVTFHTEVGDVRVKVEIADSPAARAKGLMYRDSMAADAGMVFIFPTDDDHVFWMKNTHIPLDMIFASRDLNVVGVVANAEPLTETSRSASAISRYVIEVNGGWASAHGIVAGTRLSFENVPASVTR
jgi:uncharacterized membrane protein (UPF0127 family)